MCPLLILLAEADWMCCYAELMVVTCNRPLMCFRPSQMWSGPALAHGPWWRWDRCRNNIYFPPKQSDLNWACSISYHRSINICFQDNSFSVQISQSSLTPCLLQSASSGHCGNCRFCFFSFALWPLVSALQFVARLHMSSRKTIFILNYLMNEINDLDFADVGNIYM